jgi:hypothetical protein
MKRWRIVFVVLLVLGAAVSGSIRWRQDRWEKGFIGRSESEISGELGDPVSGVAVFTPEPGGSSRVLEYGGGYVVGFDQSKRCITFRKRP